MKKFTSRFLFFCILCLTITLSLLFYTSHLIKNGDNFKIDQSTNKAFFGHSHSNNAFNDSLIQNSINLSEPTEGYLYTYFKLKTILENNEQIDSVFLEFTNNQVIHYSYEHIWGEYMPHLIPKHFSFISNRDRLKLLAKNPSTFISSIPHIIKNNLSFLLSDSNNYIDYNWSEDEIPNKSLFQEEKQESGLLASETGILKNDYLPGTTNLWYLSKIVKLCKDENIQLIFVRSPIYKPETNYSNDLLFSIYNHEFNDVVFLDFMTYPLEKKHFYDNTHLNLGGSIIFSEKFKNLLSKGVVNSKTNYHLIEEM